MNANYPMSEKKTWLWSEDLTMDLVHKVDKIPGMENFPLVFNREDVETYAIHEPFRDMYSKYFFMRYPDDWTLCTMKYDITIVGYENMQFTSRWSGIEAAYVRFKTAPTIEEAVENFKIWIHQVSN